MSRIEPTITVEEIKSQVGMEMLVTFLLEELGEDPINGERKCRCFFHGPDNTPSMIVNEETVFCFACYKIWDIIGVVREHYQLSFTDTLQWFDDHLDELVVVAVPSLPKAEKSDYLGPVNRSIVDYWHSLLTEDKREYLHNERLLTDRTIDSFRIGWRPDLKAYSIPFWRGTPGLSEIDIVQFRSTKDSPPIKGKPWKYIGFKGHNRPSLINVDLINPIFNVMLIGTFDAILGRQDGLPALSPNGVGVFLREPNLSRLLKLAGKAKYRRLVPDTSSSELLPAYRMAEALDMTVNFFPIDAQGKDYTEYRLAGGTKESFMGDVLGLDSQFVTDEQAKRIEQLLDNIGMGELNKALESLTYFEKYPTHPLVVNHTMQLFIYRARQYYPVPAFWQLFTGLEWETMLQELELCHRYVQLKEFITKWATYSLQKNADF